MTTKVTIMRKWNNPQISIAVTDEEIKMEISLKDFLEALVDEAAEPFVSMVATDAGSPALLMTNKQLQDKLVSVIESDKVNGVFVEAAERVIDAIKQETTKVM